MLNDLLTSIMDFILRNWKGIAILLLLGTAVLLANLLHTSRMETKRLSRVSEVLVQEVDSFQTRSGEMAYEIGVLELKRSELDKLAAEQEEVIHDLRIKLKRAESISTTGVVTHDSIKVPMWDTIIQRDTLLLAKGFEYHDPWMSISGYVSDSLSMHYAMRDTIDQVVERIPKKFLFIKWGTKGFNQVISLRNPNSHVEFNKTIIFK